MMNRVETVDEELVPPAPFVPLDTMFKLSEPDSSTVECVACGHMFPLSDILEGELEEQECPVCQTEAGSYWADRPHRKLDHQQEF